MKLNQKVTVLDACNVLQVELLEKNNVLKDFILENYGDTEYLVFYEDTVYLEYSKMKLIDKETGDIISIIRRDKHISGTETFAIYHSSPNNKAKASYNFHLVPNKNKIIYHGIDVVSGNNEAYIIKTDFIAVKDEIKEKNVVELKVQGKGIEKQAEIGIRNLNHYIENSKIKILSKKRETYC